MTTCQYCGRGNDRQYIFNELGWRDGLDCLKILFTTSSKIISEFQSRHARPSQLFLLFSKRRKWLSHTYIPSSCRIAVGFIVRAWEAPDHVKCCCSRGRRRLNSQFISSLGCKVQSGSTKLQIETAMPLHVAGFCTFQNANNTISKSKHCMASFPSIQYPW